MTQNINWKAYDSIELLAEAACQRVLDAAQKAIAANGAFKLVLAGGTAPVTAYQLLATKQVDWSKWHIYYGDERCLPVDDSERNSLVAEQKWLDLVAIPKAQIHRIAAELGAEAGAEQYAKVVAEAAGFDLVLLGMGEDGHTASLFPGHIHNVDELTHAVHNSPKPPADRVTISAKALSNTAELIFIVSGDKQDALEAWKSKQDIPVTQLCPESGVDVLLCV
ncbi:6-phosphogluconolactonase [Bathymodiolus platifrons methanotrophic gill symbiont]|uniref:6-phosphogluconolactonase n=1 Tax=Bathymodiolus platifrons methanotrophic gill symbiont TaxID=113268 RepID=UPI0011C83E03|nr:6-phosphogluconolactonase [Bathymodiolus platifrons methanotrophic gill symbiont]TXK95112.1 6-phosphogluconolactonase [Methylococcaceae bacterium HT1]TXL16764.1 6-phosphogluconolactonase [Methylococcaceae bacterium HT3]TXL21848.1 6-phosphogluconolactonase [Methylococcaceae bacterium HT2]GFO74602.1 6-phosphogluconolactonase [Bathymodiolus platifrons methanotrophic gill symbiont]